MVHDPSAHRPLHVDVPDDEHLDAADAPELTETTPEDQRNLTDPDREPVDGRPTVWPEEPRDA